MKYDPYFHIVLHEPEIPNNTGNIGRTCVGMESKLHLIKPYGFEITDKNLKRSGLDYWPHLELEEHNNLAEWQQKLTKPDRVFYLSTKAKRSIFEVEFQRGDYFMFGKETKGLPEDLIHSNIEQAIKIPMLGPIRSYNVANTVSVVLFEAYRQIQAK
ncbi:MAG: tRNA (cytidine(34)-2'-O)-methyltransferase [Bdellovibrionales bacterium]|nr:tRNA (cytidine(34)-2'-O)-methyltransferase [Bdellovibrionales bacterium]